MPSYIYHYDVGLVCYSQILPVMMGHWPHEGDKAPAIARPVCNAWNNALCIHLFRL